VVIKGNQSSSEAIRAHRRQSELIRGNQSSSERSSVVIRGYHQRSSEVIRGHQWSSEVIRGHQRSSEVIWPRTLTLMGASGGAPST